MSGRWQTVPDVPLTLREELIAWRKGDAQMIREWCQRQGPEVVDYVRVRGEMYGKLYPNEKPVRLWHEAAVDLLCWQRRGLPPGKAMQWLRDFEATIKEGQSRE